MDLKKKEGKEENKTMKWMRRVCMLLLLLLATCVLLAGCVAVSVDTEGVGDDPITVSVAEDGSYDSAEEVVVYLVTYGKLPSNYITKQEARKLGWEHGSVEPYAEGKCIGGDRFGNYEGRLPSGKNLRYKECDIDTLGAGSRGAKRLIYDNEGNIYYTEDHYETFVLLYEGEGSEK